MNCRRAWPSSWWAHFTCSMSTQSHLAHRLRSIRGSLGIWSIYPQNLPSWTVFRTQLGILDRHQHAKHSSVPSQCKYLSALKNHSTTYNQCHCVKQAAFRYYSALQCSAQGLKKYENNINGWLVWFNLNRRNSFKPSVCSSILASFVSALALQGPNRTIGEYLILSSMSFYGWGSIYSDSQTVLHQRMHFIEGCLNRRTKETPSSEIQPWVSSQPVNSKEAHTTAPWEGHRAYLPNEKPIHCQLISSVKSRKSTCIQPLQDDSVMQLGISISHPSIDAKSGNIINFTSSRCNNNSNKYSVDYSEVWSTNNSVKE